MVHLVRKMIIIRYWRVTDLLAPDVFTVMSVESPSELDTCFADLPLYQSIGDQLHTRFTPLRTYEGFASDVCERAGKEERYGEEKANMKKGLFYLLTTTVEYDGKIWYC